MKLHKHPAAQVPSQGTQECLLFMIPHWLAGVQVLFHIFEDAELKPILDAVNDEREKEKQKEAEG